MASLIPAIGTCVSRMTGGEKRLALRRLTRPKTTADHSAEHSGRSRLHRQTLQASPENGMPWSDMAVIYRNYGIGKPVLVTLRKAGTPLLYQDNITFAEKEDTVKFLTIHSCKGLVFRLVAIPWAVSAMDEGRKDEVARL